MYLDENGELSRHLIQSLCIDIMIMIIVIMAIAVKCSFTSFLLSFHRAEERKEKHKKRKKKTKVKRHITVNHPLAMVQARYECLARWTFKQVGKTRWFLRSLKWNDKMLVVLSTWTKKKSAFYAHKHTDTHFSKKKNVLTG